MADEGVQDPTQATASPASAPLSWRERIERDALWYALGAILLGVVVVAIGVQVAPETFWDRFVWEDLYGPLVVDARQCRTAASCPGLDSPPGIVVKDGYTITSELTYGLVLAVLLYGIYVGLFRRHGIVADGWFVGALMPWILLGPTARVLEDANVFCRAGTDCEPGVFAYFFISPVIYMHIAVYVIAFLLLGVYLQHRRHADPRLLTGAVGLVLLAGLAAYLWVAAEHGDGFSALPPGWWVALACLGALAFFHARARRGLASANLTVFVLGLPYTAITMWLIGAWLSGGVWSEAAWNDELHLDAAAFILLSATLVTLLVYALARFLTRSPVPAAWARAAGAVDEAWERRIGWAGVVAVALAALMSGILPNLSGLFENVPSKESLIPFLGLGGLALLLVFAFLHVGREAGRRPGVFLLFALGINLALVFGHLVDGLSTWVALNDPLGFGIPQYSEKHPFSEFLLRYWNGFLFPFAKLTMVLVVAWMLDKETRPSGEAEARPPADERNLVGLVKMAIFVLGFAPGLRDLLRLAMGV